MSLIDQGGVRLTIDATINGTSTTGKFELLANIQVQPGQRTGYIMDGRGTGLNNYLDQYTDSVQAGSGVFGPDTSIQSWEIQFQGWSGAKDGDGNYLQWGDDSSVSDTPRSATGQDARTQICVLNEYLNQANFSSGNTVTLEWAEYSSSGHYSPQDVVPESPSLPYNVGEGESAQTFQGQLTFLNATDLSGALDASLLPE